MQTSANFDVAVVGGGPSGTISASHCAELGLNVLLMEKASNGGKPCGGLITPSCRRAILKVVKEEIPSSVMCSPPILGVHYVSPDNRSNVGCAKDFKLLNVKRNLLDNWLRNLATKSGVNIWYDTESLKITGFKPATILAKRNNQKVRITARYLIGADGVYSRIRSQLYPNVKVDVAPILQEHWRAKGDFDGCFYVFFRRELTSAYSYVIPKDGLIVTGILAPKEEYANLKRRLDAFKKWLHKDFSFKPYSLIKREAWAIPYGFTLEGFGNIVLVGDAAGFCNALTGEGIKYAIESATLAGKSVQNALSHNMELAPIYKGKIKELSNHLHRVYQLATSLTDEDRREFVNFICAQN